LLMAGFLPARSIRSKFWQPSQSPVSSDLQKKFSPFVLDKNLTTPIAMAETQNIHGIIPCEKTYRIFPGEARPGQPHTVGAKS